MLQGWIVEVYDTRNNQLIAQRKVWAADSFRAQMKFEQLEPQYGKVSFIRKDVLGPVMP